MKDENSARRLVQRNTILPAVLMWFQQSAVMHVKSMFFFFDDWIRRAQRGGESLILLLPLCRSFFFLL